MGWIVCGLLLAAGAAHAQGQADGAYILRGMVVDSARLPVSGALVYLSAAGVFTVSDDDGWFTLSDFESWADTLNVRRRGFLPRSFRLRVAGSVDDTVDVGPIPLEPGPSPTLTLTATLRDTLRGRPIEGASVMVNDDVVGETDNAGMFSATDLPVDWGINVVLVRRVGYAPLVGGLWVGDLHARESLTGIMQPLAVRLPEVVVEADRIHLSFDRRLRDFQRRRAQGWGRFITRADIERRRPSRTSDLLRGIAWLWVEPRRILLRWAGQECEATVWLNGSPLFDSNIDVFVRPEEVAGIEVYREFGRPVEFAPLGSCGAILIWTR